MSDESGTDRRDVQRVDILGTLRADVLVAQPVLVTEISGAGIQVLSDFPFLLNSFHEFRLTLGNTVHIVRGRIIHSSVIDLASEGVQYRSGVDFSTAPDATRTVLTAYATRLTSERAGRPISD